MIKQTVLDAQRQVVIVALAKVAHFHRLALVGGVIAAKTPHAQLPLGSLAHPLRNASIGAALGGEMVFEAESALRKRVGSRHRV